MGVEISSCDKWRKVTLETFIRNAFFFKMWLITVNLDDNIYLIQYEINGKHLLKLILNVHPEYGEKYSLKEFSFFLINLTLCKEIDVRRLKLSEII